MITYIAQIPVKPECRAAYEALMTEVCEKVRANEPGVPYYAWSKSLADDDLYLVVEVYADAAAHAAHMETEWVRESLPRIATMLAGTPEIRQFATPGTEPVRRRYT